MDFRGKTILLVEDDIPSVKYFEAILLPTGVPFNSRRQRRGCLCTVHKGGENRFGVVGY